MKWLRRLYDRVMLEIRYRRKLKELRKRDPFIYKEFQQGFTMPQPL